jgi:intracellular sulfur oxidation DsrE/DsrF family protein
MFRNTLFILGAFLLAMSASQAMAGNPKTICHDGVNPSDGMDLNDEFGNGTAEITRCLANQNKPKVVMQINVACRDSYVDGTAVKNDVGHCASNRAYALGNMRNMIKDYEGSHGIDNWEIVAVVHSGGWGMLVKDGYEFTNINGEGGTQTGVKTLSNQFQSQVEDLMDRGVRFLFCQNTTRGMIGRGNLPTVAESTFGGGATEALIDGVEYTTAGVTAIADFQELGYRYVQP